VHAAAKLEIEPAEVLPELPLRSSTLTMTARPAKDRSRTLNRGTRGRRVLSMESRILFPASRLSFWTIGKHRIYRCRQSVELEGLLKSWAIPEYFGHTRGP
jgi:hypothetical protein